LSSETFTQSNLIFQNAGSLEEDLALPEEPDGQLVAENGSNGSTEIIHDEMEEIRQSKESLHSKESLQSKESLAESNESLLNDEDAVKSNGVDVEEGDTKDGESQEDKEGVALKKRM
jgi:hypothetical protein